MASFFAKRSARQPSSSSSTPSARGTPMFADNTESSVAGTTPATPATTHPSSAATSPAPESEHDYILQAELKEDEDLAAAEEDMATKVKYMEDMDEAERYRKLDFLLQKSSTYASLLHKQMDLVKSRAKVLETASTAARGRKTARGAGRGRGKGRTSAKRRKVVESEDECSENEDKKNARKNEAPEEQRFQQPVLVTGGTLKDYQLDGVAWMVSLYENGISGILADEMGLGKTLQTIAFCAYLRKRANRPFLVVCPLSTLYNWKDEFARFAPEIPVCMYHGTPEERAEMRRTVMRPVHPDDGGEEDDETSAPPVNEDTPEDLQEKVGEEEKDERDQVKDFGRGKRKRIPSTRLAGSNAPARSSTRNRKAHETATKSRSGRVGAKKRTSPLSSDHDGSEDYQYESDDDSIEEEPSNPWTKSKSKAKFKTKKSTSKRTVKASRSSGYYQPLATFPVVITTYDIIIRDRKSLGSKDYEWGYIVVDEGHRLKNLDCKLVREIKQYKSACRLILTGTPLHNNLGELWSLLNFILPDIFDDLSTFQQWFNIPTLSSKLSSTQTHRMITQLHSILKPFLLRRLKVDVEFGLPPKKEYVLYAPLTQNQKGIYEAVVNGAIRRWLIEEKSGQKGNGDAADSTVNKVNAVDDVRKLRKRSEQYKPSYAVDAESDQDYFKRVNRGDFTAFEQAEEDRRWGNLTQRDEDEKDVGKAYMKRAAVKQVNNLRLQNVVMQLRKVCSHPFLFDWPIDPVTGSNVVSKQLVRASGKMLVLERLLDELFHRGHRVLLFSQFTTMLDIIEDWATEFKQWPLCRIDGSTKPLERRDEMQRFQEGRDDDSQAPKLFLLSTRAGGLGINLTRADTVIFYDSDWNPQMDMQAQDRAHRIGQTKPVLIFRLVSAHTIETSILQRATDKRKLEALVIAKGKFKVPGSLSNNATNNKESLTELAASLLRLEGEKIDVVSNADAGKTEVISDKNLDVLLDRSPHIFEERGKGWTGSADEENVEEKHKTSFEVFETGVVDDSALVPGLSEPEDNEEFEDLLVADDG